MGEFRTFIFQRSAGRNKIRNYQQQFLKKN